MTAPWGPIICVDIIGSILMLLISGWCAIYAWQLTRKRPDDVFRSYIFLFTLAILFFAVSRSVGHLVKQLLLLNGMETIWTEIAPFSGAVNSTAFVVIFAFGISFQRFQKVHTEIEYYKNNLEEMIATRTKELEKAKNTLENILDNANPINITGVDFDLLQANEAYYALWPRAAGRSETIKCYESRPGVHCHTAECPLQLIIGGQAVVTQEVSKNLNGQIREFIVTARPFKDIDGHLIGMVESFLDITFRKQAEKAIRESEERFRKIFESNPDPVILAKLSDGTIIDTNRAFEAATGILRITALGHNAEELGLWIDRDRRLAFREMLQLHGEVSNYEASFHVTGGAIKTGLISASRLSIHDEPCILLVIRDITTEKAAERALIEMDRIKSEFISTAAHELNTPLSTMMGYAEFLRNPDQFGPFTEAQQQEFINEVYDNGEALSRIIEDLLDIGRIERGDPIPLVRKEYDIAAFIRSKAKSFTTHHPHHPIRLELPDAPLKPLLMLDRHRLNQALDNLLSNAVKYSPHGTPIVVAGRPLAEGWEIRVADRGIGMTAAQIERIFDKFYRVDASNTAVRGMGLGMSIVKQVIEAHGGSIRVESVEGVGTTVLFTLPYANF